MAVKLVTLYGSYVPMTRERSRNFLLQSPQIASGLLSANLAFASERVRSKCHKSVFEQPSKLLSSGWAR